MIRKTILLSLFVLTTQFIFAQKGVLTNEMIDNFRTEFKSQPENKVKMNAVSYNEPKKLVKNRENEGKTDHIYTHKVKTAGISDQKSSGRCWLFTGLNVIKPHALKNLNIRNFEFSENYSFFWDQIEKSNLFLEAIIYTADLDMTDRKVEWLFKNTIGDGGVWSGFADVVEKYGVVPVSAMPETYSSSNTTQMRSVLRKKLKENGLALRRLHKEGKSEKELRQEKEKMLSEVYRILAFCLGEPPQEFIWRYTDKNDSIIPAKTYTPLSFYKEAIDINLTDYVLLMNDPTRPYFKLYEIEYDRNMHEGHNWKYINLPNEQIKLFAAASIKDNEAMYFSCDVGKQLDSEEGTLDMNNYDYASLFGIELGMDKKERIQTFESGSSHGMALVGVDLDENGKTKNWLIENSWGAKSGHNGYLNMTDAWFDNYMFRVVVKKKYISEDVLKILSQKPVMLPPWDPMFDYDK